MLEFTGKTRKIKIDLNIGKINIKINKKQTQKTKINKNKINKWETYSQKPLTKFSEKK